MNALTVDFNDIPGFWLGSVLNERFAVISVDPELERAARSYFRRHSIRFRRRGEGRYGGVRYALTFAA
jgi:hypothetical protein